MSKNFYSCPHCHKQTSSTFDVNKSMFSFGFASILKEKCNFCGGKIIVSWPHYFIGALIHVGIIGGLVASAFIFFPLVQAKYHDIIAIASFALLLPVGLVFFHVLMPIILGKIGLRLYKK